MSTDNQKSLSWDKIKLYILLSVSAIGLVIFLWCFITPTVLVIEYDKDKGEMTHRTENVLGSLIVMNSEGEEVCFDDLKCFNRYIYNGTDELLIEYNVIYSNDDSAVEEFEEEFKLMAPDELIEVDVLPDFYFEEPESINISENIFISLFNSIFGIESSRTRWIIDRFYTE